MGNRKGKRDDREERARLRRQKNMSDEQRLTEYRRRRELFSTYLNYTINVKRDLMDRRCELEIRTHRFIHERTPEQLESFGYTLRVFYDQGVFDGRLHELRNCFFVKVRNLKSMLIKEGVHKKERIDAELNQIDTMFLKLTEDSHRFAEVIRIQYLKQIFMLKLKILGERL